MPYYTYILKSEKDKRFYIGQTGDIEKRLEKHNKGYEKYTRKFTPWELCYCKEFTIRKEAVLSATRLKTYLGLL